MHVGDGHVELAAPGVLEGQKFLGAVVQGHGFEPQVATDPVLVMHHRGPRGELGEAANDQLRRVPSPLLSAPGLLHPLPEKVCFRDHGKLLRRQVEAMEEGGEGEA